MRTVLESVVSAITMLSGGLSSLSKAISLEVIDDTISASVV